MNSQLISLSTCRPTVGSQMDGFRAHLKYLKNVFFLLYKLIKNIISDLIQQEHIFI